MEYLVLYVQGLLPVLLTYLLLILKNKTRIAYLSSIKQQLIFGLCWAVLAGYAIFNNVIVNGAAITFRDTAPICAAFFFGPIAGIVAGTLGAIIRTTTVFFGFGNATLLSCSVATFCIGILAAIVKVYVLKKKAPGWYYALFFSLLFEILHLTLIFVFSLNDVLYAFSLVTGILFPMLIVNSIPVSISSLVYHCFYNQKDSLFSAIKEVTLNKILSLRVFAVMLGSFLVMLIFIFVVQSAVARYEAENLTQQYVDDVSLAISNACSEMLMNNCYLLSKIILPGKVSNTELADIAKRYQVYEINIVDNFGIVKYSSHSDLVGFDIRSTPQTSEFMCLTQGQNYHLQYFHLNDDSVNSDHVCYVGVSYDNGGFLQIGLTSEDLKFHLEDIVSEIASNRHIEKNGYVLVADANGTIVSDVKGFYGKNLQDIGFSVENKNIDTYQKCNFLIKFYDLLFSLHLQHGLINDQQCVFNYKYYEGFYILAIMSSNDAMEPRDTSMVLISMLIFLIFGTIFIQIQVLIRNNVIDKLIIVRDMLRQISKGNLDTQVDIRGTVEFSELSFDINTTVNTLKELNYAQLKRMEDELAVASKIQSSSLPKIDHVLPKFRTLDLYAFMKPAVEVGGDFYDFYPIDDYHYVFMIADVSGKGISSAMFMMRAMSIIKASVQSHNDLSSAITETNENLCENNVQEFFVTAWIGILNTAICELEFVNAGHNPPVINYGEDSGFRYLRTTPNLVLGGMPGIQYKSETIGFPRSASILLYTDGVTEAFNSHNEQYGEQRLLNCLNSMHRDFDNHKFPRRLCRAVFASVKDFEEDKSQSDDIAMVAVSYNTIDFFTLEAKLDNLPLAAKKFETLLEKNDISEKIVIKLNVCVDEILSNIINYSRAIEMHMGCVRIHNHIMLYFADNGKPYNPLDVEAPDLKLSVEERSIGGLGIHIVKEFIDKIQYHYVDGYNILILNKNVDKSERR